MRGDITELNEMFNGKRYDVRSRNMTGRLHALLWQGLQRLLDVNQRSAREGRDIHRVLYPRLFWEHPLQRCAVNPCIRVSIKREMNRTCLFSLCERNVDDIRLCMASTNGPPG
jgi:hypothetical protein